MEQRDQYGVVYVPTSNQAPTAFSPIKVVDTNTGNLLDGVWTGQASR